ncbi:hypothetical protein Hanom_Chr05g00448671 [Helianthus anomalus]
MKKMVLSLAMASSISIFLFTISLNLGIEDKLNSFRIRTNKTGSSTTISHFAYLASGSKGDLNKLWRRVRALYHPWNYYVHGTTMFFILILNRHSRREESLFQGLKMIRFFSAVGNVYVIPKANMVSTCLCHSY